MANDKIKTILNNFKNDIGHTISKLNSEVDIPLGIDSTAGNRLYIVDNYDINIASNSYVTIDGMITESYLIMKWGSKRKLIKVPELFDKKLGKYHRRFTPTREVYLAKSSL